jgi:hypothetical protein
VLSVGVFDANAPGPPVEVLSIRRGPDLGSRTARIESLNPSSPESFTSMAPVSRSEAGVVGRSSRGARAGPTRRGPNVPTRAATVFDRGSWRR